MTDTTEIAGITAILRHQVAEVIDRHCDEDTYLPCFDADGEIVSSAAGDAVLKLLLPLLREQIPEEIAQEVPHSARNDAWFISGWESLRSQVLAMAQNRGDAEAIQWAADHPALSFAREEASVTET